jgi:hypothetical protein
MANAKVRDLFGSIARYTEHWFMFLERLQRVGSFAQDNMTSTFPLSVACHFPKIFSIPLNIRRRKKFFRTSKTIATSILQERF